MKKENPPISIHHGDCIDTLRTLEDCSIDAVICDPPYGLSKPPPINEVLNTWLSGDKYAHKKNGFMGNSWDSFVPGPEVWKECFRVLKPGGHLIAFFGTRTYHVGALAVEIAGFEMRDMIAWLYAMGFPKSQDIGKSMDRAKGVLREVIGYKKGANDFRGNGYMKSNGRRNIPITKAKSRLAKKWEGWGSSLKPAHEPIVVARKPPEDALYKNVLKYGTGGLNIDACRVPAEVPAELGRYPANVCHDGSDGVENFFKEFGERKTGGNRGLRVYKGESFAYRARRYSAGSSRMSSSGLASRFFFCGKATRKERGEMNDHPTVKPLALMNWLVLLVTPPGGTILDPFAGSGTTGIAAVKNGFKAILVEREEAYIKIIRKRLRAYKIAHACKKD